MASWYARFYYKSYKGESVPLMGSDSIVVLDGRLSQHRAMARVCERAEALNTTLHRHSPLTSYRLSKESSLAVFLDKADALTQYMTSLYDQL